VRVCVFGAGAVGGYLGARLIQAGVDVTLIARGRHLRAIQEHGLALEIAGERHVVRARAVEVPAKAGTHDVVFVAVKAHSLPEVAGAIEPLLETSTVVVSVMNGIPWWYFQKLAGPHENRYLESVDPEGALLNTIDAGRIIGCIAFASAEVTAPGVVRHSAGTRFVLGELDGSSTPRIAAISAMLTSAGFDAPIATDIREVLWIKLWLNLSFNPISVLTHGTLAGIAADPATREVVRDMMTEARTVAERLGVRFTISVDTRIEQAAAVGPHKTSMLQDLERGRPLELGPLVVAVQEMARLVKVDTPTIDVVVALARQRARLAGLYPVGTC